MIAGDTNSRELGKQSMRLTWGRNGRRDFWFAGVSRIDEMPWRIVSSLSVALSLISSGLAAGQVSSRAKSIVCQWRVSSMGRLSTTGDPIV